jgi:hypothetical protein
MSYNGTTVYLFIIFIHYKISLLMVINRILISFLYWIIIIIYKILIITNIKYVMYTLKKMINRNKSILINEFKHKLN